MSSKLKRLSHIRLAQLILSLLPLVSFVAQYILSQRLGTTDLFLRHPTVVILDWIFVPFNISVVPTIDWRRGMAIFAISATSLSLNAVATAFWQATGADPGHMIAHGGIILPAGWVHFVFSACETTLLLAFVFCRYGNAPRTWVANVLATSYFVGAAACGYSIHHALIISDALTSGAGILLVIIAALIEQVRRAKASIAHS